MTVISVKSEGSRMGYHYNLFTIVIVKIFTNLYTCQDIVHTLQHVIGTCVSVRVYLSFLSVW